MPHAQLTTREIHGSYTQLLTNLQGDDGQEWLTALKRFLRKENPWPKTFHDFPIWKTITLPKGMRPSDYRRAFKRKSIRMQPSDDQLLSTVEMISPAMLEYDLVMVTPAELGFTDTTRYSRVRERALSLGFRLCPIEVGLALRLVYLDQPAGHLYVAIEGPWPDDQYKTLDFACNVLESEEDTRPDGSEGLHIRFSSEDFVAHLRNWYPTNKVIFLKPRK